LLGGSIRVAELVPEVGKAAVELARSVMRCCPPGQRDGNSVCRDGFGLAECVD